MSRALRFILSGLVAGAGAAHAVTVDNRVVLASVVAHAAIIEAQTSEAIYFERCDYYPTAGEVHGAVIPPDHLTNCHHVGAVLPNVSVVRRYLEARFTEELNLGLQRLDATGVGASVARDGLAAGAIVGGTVLGLETLLRDAAWRARLTTAGAFAALGAGMVWSYRAWSARQARYEQSRSKQIQRVIDLTIPPEPQLIDEKATSRGEALAVMHLFTTALKNSVNVTRAHLAILLSEGSPL